MRKSAAALAVIAFLLAGCASTPPDQGSNEVVRVASSGVCVCHAPIYVGIAEGIFEKHGIDVEARQTPSGFESQAMVAAGEVEVGDAAVAVAAAADSQGLSNTALFLANGNPSGTASTDDYFAIVGAPGSGLQEGDLESLRGATIGAATGTIAHMYLLAALDSVGIGEDEVTVQNVSPPDIPTALQSGSVDAIVGWEPAPLLAENLVEGSVEVFRGGNFIDYIFMRWVNPNWISEHPDAVQAFVDGFAESAAFIRANPEESSEIIAEALETDVETVSAILPYLTFDMRYSPLSEENISAQIEFAKEFGGFEGDYAFPDHYAAEFVENTMQEHPEFFADLPAVQ